jgi:hypothetical protein
MRIAHIVNPVVVPPDSDLGVAQPVTFETMRIARAAAAGCVDVDLLTAQYAEDRAAVPAGFRATPDLERSLLDFGTFAKPRKLPLIGDIVERLSAASDADYLVYTNVDIALMPSFYVAVAAMIAEGHDALVINRRTISKDYTAIADLPLMFGQAGSPHGGRDCFVWRREVTPRFVCGRTVIGQGGVGRVLQINLAATATRFREYEDQHLTFHLGDDRTWELPDQDDSRAFNWAELVKVVDTIRARGELPDHPAVTSFLERRGLVIPPTTA